MNIDGLHSLILGNRHLLEKEAKGINKQQYKITSFDRFDLRNKYRKTDGQSKIRQTTATVLIEQTNKQLVILLKEPQRLHLKLRTYV